MSRTPARYAAVPSFEPLSITISSHAGRVFSLSEARHCCVNSSWPQPGTMMVVSSRAILLLIDVAPRRKVQAVESASERHGLCANDGLPSDRPFSGIEEHPFAGAKGDNGRSFNVAFRSAKGCIET